MTIAPENIARALGYLERFRAEGVLNHINGQAVRAVSGKTFEIISPVDLAPLADVARGDAADIDAAARAAHAAFAGWAAVSGAERRKILHRIADGIEARAEEIAFTESMDTGQALRFMSKAALRGAENFRFFADKAAEARDGQSLRAPGQINVTSRAPLGPVGIITPWNFPFMMVTQKLGPALITGNTVVAKPAPTTPMCALKIAELAADIFPAGVINVIVDNNDLGAALSSHPDVAKVSFTGSTGTGRKIFAAGADDLKRITLELGGNDAAIVMDDVDPKTVAPKLFNGAMVNAGQVCLAIKRVYAHASIYDELCAELATLAENAVVDDGANQGAQIGPVQNKMQYDKLLGFLDDAAANGTVLAGGKPLDRDGYFIAPTIVRDIADDSRLVREEQFGPILPIMKFDDIDDAITRANDNEYGLGGTIWAGDVDRGVEVAMKIDSGTVWVNKHLDLPFDVPFGGSKQSGVGREGGDEGLFAYSQPHVVNIAKAAI